MRGEEVVGGVKVGFALRYEGLVKRVIVQYKYRFSEELVEVLGAILRERAGLVEDEVMIVAVPLHVRRWRQRGFNQAELLGRALGEVNDCLERVRWTGAQAKLGREERLVNLRGAFVVKAGYVVSGRRVLLVDDVCTTGSTLRECVKVLEEAGAAEVKCLVLARGR